MFIKSILLVISLVVLAALCPAQAAPRTRADCEKLVETSDQATYRRCLGELAQRQNAPLDDVACSPKACLYRLACRHDDSTNVEVCEAPGWRLEVRPSDIGRSVFITGRDGRVTRFSVCGTCSNADWEFGPLKTASWQFFRDDAVALRIEGPRQ